MTVENEAALKTLLGLHPDNTEGILFAVQELRERLRHQESLWIDAKRENLTLQGRINSLTRQLERMVKGRVQEEFGGCE